MIARICARLSLIVGVAGLVQIPVHGQAAIDAAQPQFGTEPAPYAQPSAQPSPAAVPADAEPVEAGAASFNPGTVPVAVPAGPMRADSPESAIDFDPSTPLDRGDVVSFSIVQDRDAPRIMRVTDTGELDFSEFPKIGRFSVAGKTCGQVAAELKHKLEADYYNQADVRLGIDQVRRVATLGKVYISGNVKAPGSYDIMPGERMTVSTAIIRAGGFDKFANQKAVQVTHKNKDGTTERMKVDVKSIINNGRMDRDVELRDGDYVNVPQNIINF